MNFSFFLGLSKCQLHWVSVNYIECTRPNVVDTSKKLSSFFSIKTLMKNTDTSAKIEVGKHLHAVFFLLTAEQRQ